MTTIEEMEAKWPLLPPNQAKRIAVFSFNGEVDIEELTQDSIDDLIEYFKTVKEVMNS